MPKPNETPDVPMDAPIESLQAPDPGALAAMQAALAGTDAPPPADTPPADAPPADAPPADAPPADTPPADAPPADAPPADAPPADAPPADTPPARASDVLGELPKDAKQETRERWEQMREKFDALDEERGRAALAADTWHQTISSTGATPEQFGQTLSVLRDINQGTPESLQRAYAALQAQTQAIAKQLGMPATGYDPIDEHPDLKARVENSVDFTREDALLIIQARKAGSLQDTVRQRDDAATQQAALVQAETANVRALGAQLRATDPVAFAAKLPFLTPIIETTIQRLPPKDWVGAISEAYAKLPMPAVAPATPPATPPVVPNPLRPGGSGGGHVDKTPTTALEAMQLALAQNAGR